MSVHKKIEPFDMTRTVLTEPCQVLTLLTNSENYPMNKLIS
ncbi:hypothetical protein ASZ90_018472 [hydrocarbon metagenome]|uniref:Uncharacterized protein n=1 Tax=hydrocarbon metagenome TaxID=938273 RepID=A0A0W8E657_9ZZZZ